MKKKVLCYGLGHDFIEDYAAIHEKYDVIGYSDRNEKRAIHHGGTKAIARSRIKEYVDQVDYILLTLAECRMDAAQELVLNFEVPIDKLYFFRYIGDGDNYTFTDVFKRQVSFFGQFYDDVLLWHIFQRLSYDLQHVRYLEIGTNDPILSNNSYFFYAHGASGCLIDPLPLSERFCKIMRPRDQFIRAAVSSVSGSDVTFFLSPGTQVSSLHREFAGEHHLETIVPKLGINELIASLNFMPDLVLVDAEGEDERILRALNYTKYHPIVIEAEMDKMEHGDDFQDFMRINGYTLLTQLGGNFFFIDTEKWNEIK